MNYTELTRRAQNGDHGAFGLLYESTYKSMYYLALKYMKNSTEAEDVLQESYIKAWNNIAGIKEPEKFNSWLSCIVSNTAKNSLNKKNPVLFSQIEGSGDGDEEFIYDAADTSIENQPELSFTQNETKELVNEMIDSLTDEQRFCILMFYMEQQSIAEISNTLGVSPNTVKSRLNYGKKNLKKKADELQKNGCRFFGIAPVALLLLLMKKEEASAAVLYAAEEAMDNGYKQIPVLKQASEEAVKAEAVSKTVSAGAKAATGKGAVSAGGKLAAVIIAAAVGGTAIGTTAALIINKNKEADVKTVQAAEKESVPEKEDNIVTSESPKGDDIEKTADKIEGDIEKLYQDKINEFAYSFGYDPSEMTVVEMGPSDEDVYGYFLYDLDGDGISELFIMQGYAQKQFIYNDTDIYTCIKDDDGYDILMAAENEITQGYFRPQDSNGIYEFLVTSTGLGTEEFYWVSMENGKASKDDNAVKVTQLGSDDSEAFMADNPRIEWQPLSTPVSSATDRDKVISSLKQAEDTGDIGTKEKPDISVVSNNEKTGNKERPSIESINNAEAEAENAEDEHIQELESAGNYVLQGTMYYVSYYDLLSLQGISDPNPGSSYGKDSYYTVLVLDSPQTLSFMAGDGDGTRSGQVSLINITDLADATGYNGTRMMVALNPGNYYWPSDVSVPVGEPRGSGCEIIKTY